MYNLFLSQEAKADLFRIYNYGFHKFGETQAEKYLAKLYDFFDKIESNPLLFPKAFNYRDADRYAVCGVDTIFYNIAEFEIEVITIIGRQDYS